VLEFHFVCDESISHEAGSQVVPNIKSAIKRVKVAERNRQRNRTWKSSVRTVRTEVQDAVKAVNAEQAQEALKNAYAVIDQAVAKGVLHRNSAARKKSRLATSINKLGTAGAKATKAKPAKAPAKKTQAKKTK